MLESSRTPLSFPVSWMVKNLPTMREGLIPGLGRSPLEGNGYPLQYCCLENPVDRGAKQATVHGLAKSDMTERLN